MLKYNQIDPRKKAFIFELDNVLFPEKDYQLQVYYLFAHIIEYLETTPPGSELTEFMKRVYLHHGPGKVFDRAKEAFGLDEKYRQNLDQLDETAKLPLKLLLFQEVLDLLQEIVVDRKKLFLVTDGNRTRQLNKIKQIEWRGIEKYFTMYFTEESAPKPETASLEIILRDHDLLRRDLVIIGANDTDQQYAAAGGVDYIDVRDLIGDGSNGG